MKIRVGYHCSSLKETLDSEKPISQDAFERLLKSGLYKFYAFDDRISADRYILIDIEVNYGLPIWIHVYK